MAPGADDSDWKVAVGRLNEFGFSIAAGPTALSLRRSNNLARNGYELLIDRGGIQISGNDAAGVHAAISTLRQILREHGRQLPCLSIRDWPDFERRGVMLDVSRGRVPNLKTLLQLAEHLADFKVNELQLYFEHTFAHRDFRSAWQSWGAITPSEIRKLSAHCRRLGIDLVPNQNSFGHLRELLAHPELKALAEVSGPYESSPGEFLRYPSTFAPNHPDVIPLLRRLYDGLLPGFSSDRFNVGCDETWDLGRGQSRALCERRGKGRVYLDFLLRVQREVSRRGLKMMFWGDIILKHPKLIRELPRNTIALNWGYEADHPFEREARLFARAGIPFYVCPGTSTWMTLIGRHDNAYANLEVAARAGRKAGAVGYLITDWGDGGHPQPLAVSYIPFAFGAAMAWSPAQCEQRLLKTVLSRDVFHDPTHSVVRAALKLGVAHRRLEYFEPNSTPLGAAIAAPPLAARELFCRNGLKYFSRIPARRIRSAWREIELQLGEIKRSKPQSIEGRILREELELAARMAAESCRFMLWQQALEKRETTIAGSLARSGAAEMRRLQSDFNRYWPSRNKATPAHCSAFLDWRLADYRRGHVT